MRGGADESQMDGNGLSSLHMAAGSALHKAVASPEIEILIRG